MRVLILTMLGRFVMGAPSNAAVWTRWYRDAVCQICQKKKSPNCKTQIDS
jgi:hypothetical protein